ncbi:methionine--tRNA ligase [Nocardia sp. NPDC059691]|uniref:methionine--tRNA ligase n=1 Tax=Nocardia sp. NPDC059691 TaxID=3346908 RepID=UPI0036B48CB1
MGDTVFASTTIPYVNARPHLGHALEYVQADAYVRSMAQHGDDVFFLTGADENSLKNVLAAEREGMSTRELVDRNVIYFEELIKSFDIEVRDFIRTSARADHHAGAQEIWRRIAANGDLYTKDYEGLYCVGCEQYYDRAELVDGKCPEHLTVPELVRESNYFFRLSRYADQLLDAIESGRIKIFPQTRQNEITGFIRSGLADISVSRSMERAHGWGIEVPGDSSQVIYVWIDALTNYINALGWSRDAEEFETYWNKAARRIHFLGKGVIRFHAVYWPAMLLSAGLPLPTDLVVHGYVTANGQKLSKSLGNVVDPIDLVNRYGIDAVRYYLLAELTPFGDGDFSEERLIARHNTDLSNGLGNLVSRVTSMIGRYRDGVVPAPGQAGSAEQALADEVVASAAASLAAAERYDYRESLAAIWKLVRQANAYVDEKAPWNLAKTGDDAELDLTLFYLAAAVRQLGGLILPYLPDPGAAILRCFEGPDRTSPQAATWLDDLAGQRLEKPDALFPRLEPVG